MFEFTVASKKSIPAFDIELNTTVVIQSVRSKFGMLVVFSQSDLWSDSEVFIPSSSFV